MTKSLTLALTPKIAFKRSSAKSRVLWLILAWLAGATGIGSTEVMAQQAFGEANVNILIRINPIARVDFPQGTGFVLVIPSREEGRGRGGPFTRGPAPHLDSAQIPFIVTGNSWVTITAEPGAIFTLPPRSPVGRAFGDVPVGIALLDDPDASAQESAIPYTLWIEFPAGLSGRSPAGLGNPSGKNPTKQSALQASVANGPISGIVHVVPNIVWGDIASGRFVNSGIYRGEVQVTVTASGP